MDKVSEKIKQSSSFAKLVIDATQSQGEKILGRGAIALSESVLTMRSDQIKLEKSILELEKKIIDLRKDVKNYLEKTDALQNSIERLANKIKS